MSSFDSSRLDTLAAAAALVLLAAVSGDARALPGDCEPADRPELRSPETELRELLGGLVPSMYVRLDATVARGTTRTNQRPTRPDTDLRRTDSGRTSGIRFEVGVRWHPIELIRALDDRGEAGRTGPALRRSTEICRRLEHLRLQLQSTTRPDLEGRLEREILERKLQAVTGP